MPKGMFYLEVFICDRSLFRTFCTSIYTCHLWWNYKAQSFHKSKHLLVRSILSSDLVWSSRIQLGDIGQDYCMSTITVDDNSVYKPVL